jgi:uncharacterized protein YdhG (YjbR/CyaY superfamily)
MKKAALKTGNSEQVNEFMLKLDHPYKDEVQMIRDLIMRSNREISEQIKWKAPSFSYKGEYLVTFNLWAKQHIHLVFHNPAISQVKSGILEGDYKDRRMVYFSGLEDVKQKREAFEKVLQELIEIIDQRMLSPQSETQ